MRPVCARQTPRAALGRCKPASVPVQRRFATQSSSGSPHPKKGGPHQCWSCKVYPLSFRDAFFCGSCGTVQPETNEVDCFQKIGLPFKYDIDIKDLDTRFKAMQRKLHPDFFHGKPKREQELSDELSKAVNRCYRTLKDPNLRGLYMLRVKGFEIKDGERVKDVNFLQQMMELHELLSEKPDAATLARLKADNDAILQKTYGMISEAFKNEKFAEARDLLVQVQYLERIADELHQQTPVK